MENILEIKVYRKVLLKETQIITLTLLQPEPWIILPFHICQSISYNLETFSYSSPRIKIIEVLVINKIQSRLCVKSK